MNVVIEVGRLAKDPEVRYSAGSDSMCVARFTLAVDRPRKGEQAGTDWIQCTAFGRTGEFVEKYLRKGMKIVVEGRIQTGKYEKDGNTTYTWTVVATSIEFAEKKEERKEEKQDRDGFIDITKDVIGEELPFN